MSYIEWELDTEDEDCLDAYDPLGKLIILGDQGRIVEENTYLDAFFEGLVDGIQRIEVGKTIRIDPLVEPDDIVFECTSDRVSVSYGDQKTIILDRVKLFNDLRQAVNNFVEIIDNLTVKAGQEKRQLLILRRYLEDTSIN